MLRINLPFVSKEALLEYDWSSVRLKRMKSWLEVSTAPRKFLIVRLSAIGDVIHVLPALRSLRENFPSAHIAWLVEDKAEGILKKHPDLDEIIVFPKKRWITGLKNPFTFLQTAAEIASFITNLRKQGFEMAVDFQGNLKSGIMTLLSGSPLRIGFARGHCKEGNFLFTNYWVAPPSKRLHKIEKNLSLLEGLGLRTTREGVSLPFLKEDDEYVAAQLVRNAEYGMRNCKLRTANSAIRTQPLVVIHAGTSDFGAYKRWPAASYAQLADKVVEELNAYVVFTWESSELEMVKEIISVMRHPGHLAPKTETLGQLASLIRRADLFISGDTGPMHIASALGVPQVAIFGPKDPIIYGPYQKNAVVVRKELDCSPCTKRTCNNPICITSITPGEVFGAARALLR